MAFILKVSEVSRPLHRKLDEESKAVIRIDLLDLLAQADSLDLDAKLAHNLLLAVQRFFRREISAGVFGDSELIPRGQLKTGSAAIAVQRIAREVSQLRCGANRRLG
jgi:hypothetical protein